MKRRWATEKEMGMCPVHSPLPLASGESKMWKTSQPSENGVFHLFPKICVFFFLSFHEVATEVILRRREESSLRCPPHPNDSPEESQGLLSARG